MRARVLLAVSALALAGCGGGGGTTGTRIDASSPLHDFALHDADGRVVSLASLRGRYVIVSFLYTHCTDVCPLIAEHVRETLRSLHDPRVAAVAVSVDPSGDTPAAVRAFLRAHRVRMDYLLGSLDELQPVWQEFNVLVEARSSIRVAHDAPLFVVGPDGRPLLLEPSSVTAAELARDVRRLL